MRKSIAVSAAAVAAVGTILASSPAWASGTPSTCPSGTSDCASATGTVTVATSLTLSITSGASFTANEIPGTSATGVPPTDLTVLTNGPGYTLTSFMDDTLGALEGGATYYPSTSAFTDPAGDQIADTDWSVTTNGGAAQTYPAAPGVNNGGTQPTITLASTTGPSAANGDSYTEQLTLEVPAVQPNGTYTGAISFLAVGNA